MVVAFFFDKADRIVHEPPGSSRKGNFKKNIYLTDQAVYFDKDNYPNSGK
jgi:hypothetical protein